MEHSAPAQPHVVAGLPLAPDPLGDVLLPDGEHGVQDVKGLADSDFDRRMDDNRYRELPVIMEKLKEGIDLAQRVLADRSVGFLRGHTYAQPQSPQWGLMIGAHPTGVTPAGDGGGGPSPWKRP